MPPLLPTPHPTPVLPETGSGDERSYDQMNTGALIRPACSSTNPGIQGAALSLPPEDHLPQGDTDPQDLMSTLRGCFGAIMES